MSVQRGVVALPDRRGPRPSLLDVAAEVLVADPSASLASVAAAAGIGRTTLHKHYATREDLVLAVAHRALDLWDQAVAGVVPTDTDGGFRHLVEAMVPIGPQLAFLWRNPIFDHDAGIARRVLTVEPRVLAILHRAQECGVLDSETPDWWLVQMLYSLVYVASESIWSGHLAPRNAADLVGDTFVHGLGARRATPKATPPKGTHR